MIYIYKLTVNYDLSLKTYEIVGQDHEPSYNLQLGALCSTVPWVVHAVVLCPKFDGHNPWRIHGAGRKMLTWRGFLLMGSMLPYIAAPWILWVILGLICKKWEEPSALMMEKHVPRCHFMGIPPFSLTNFGSLFFSPQSKRCKWLQLWPFTSYDRLFLWDYTCYKWGDFSTNITGITWAMSLCLTEEFAEHLMEILRKGWGSWGRLDSSSVGWSHLMAENDVINHPMGSPDMS